MNLSIETSAAKNAGLAIKVRSMDDFCFAFELKVTYLNFSSASLTPDITCRLHNEF